MRSFTTISPKNLSSVITVTFLLCFTFLSSAQIRVSTPNTNQQTPEPNKYAKELQRIVNSYDQNKLSALYTESMARDAFNKTEVASYALSNNIPIRYEDENGTLFELQFIADDGTPIYYRTFNVNAAISTRANYLNTSGGLGLDLNGDDLTAHVWDGGLARSTHQEYDGPGGTNRFSIGDGTSALHYHSAHVTGTIIATGVVGASKGMAWQADAIGYDWNSDVPEATTAASGGMLISNHSYGYGASGIPDAWFGQYGQDARDWDGISYNAPYFLMMVAAGNDGNDNTSNALPLDGFTAYDKLSGHATAKNNLVVANGQDASIDGSGNLISVLRNTGSSEGPTDDYRIKPDIMGNGTSLYSTYETSNSAYNSISGTSMASPNVAGSLLLLQEHYFNLNSSFMRAATLKGLALHTADDVSPSGPDAQTGWGLLNVKRAAETLTTAASASGSAIVDEITLTQGQTYQITVQSNGVDPLMASISWTDPAASINNGTNSNTPALINDLDIRLDNGSSFTPWRLTGVTTNGVGDNVVDPYERIDINSAAGSYTLTVTHKGTLSSGSQDFSLIVTGIVVATTPVINYAASTGDTIEDSNCGYTDILIPLNIAQSPSANATVNFTIAGGTATNTLDYDLLTPFVTFPMGSTASQNMEIRVYHDSFVDGSETAIIDFTVDANGGDASADPNGDSFTLTILDDDAVPVPSQVSTLLTEDFETAAWASLDGDGDGNDWRGLTGLTYTGITGSFPGSETDLTVLGGIGTANANNYLISPQMNIPSEATNVDFTYGIGGYQTIEHYAVYWTTNVSTPANINSGILLEERNAPANAGEFRTVGTSAIAGQTGYFVVRHFNSSSNNGILLFDNITFDAVVTTAVQTTVNTPTLDQIVIPTSGTVYTSDSATAAVMADIQNSNTFDYDCVDVLVSRAGTGAQSYNGSSYPNLVTDKTFDISPVNTTGSGNTSITFYFTEAEIAGWETTTGLLRGALEVARGTASTVTETSSLAIGSFGGHVTLTGTFTGLDGTYYFGPASAFVLPCAGPAKIWDGSAWSGGGAPTASNTVTINGTYDTAIHGDITACSLTVNSGRTLTVRGGDFIQINGNIINNGTLVVDHEGTIVQTDANPTVTNSGTINVLLDTPNLASRDFMILGSPMTGETRGSVWSSAFLVLDHNTLNFVPHPDVEIQFPGAENFADDNNDAWAAYGSGGSVDPGRGYLVRPQAGYGQPGGIFNYTYDDGTLNTGDVTFSVIYNTPGPTAADNKNASPNVLANPYPSSIYANDFINANAMIDEVFFWEHLTPPNTGLPGAGSMNFSMEDISMYNLSGGVGAGNPEVIATRPNGYISTGQGFGIKATASGTATFTNAMRRTTNNNTLRAENDKDRLWLNVENAQYEMGGSTLIAFNENATSGIDSGYDSRRLATVVSLYSHLEDGSRQLGIQTREAFESGMKVPVGFSSQLEANLEYKISISTLEGDKLEGATVYLIDNYTNTVTNLSEGAYVFSSNKGTFHNRFTLQFEGEDVLGSNDTIFNTVSILPNPTSGSLFIVSPVEPILGLEVYDVIGRKLKNISVNSQEKYTLDISSLESAVYFITVNTANGSLTKRVVKK